MAKPFDELPLEEQLTMPISYQRELVARPPELRAEGAVNKDGRACTRYFRRRHPTSGRWEWEAIAGADCSARYNAPPAAGDASQTAVAKCTIASPYVALAQRWDTGQAGNPAYVSRWLNDFAAASARHGPVCRDQVDNLNTEIDRLLRSAGGSRNAVPLQVKPPVQALAKLASTASSHTVASGGYVGGRTLTIPAEPVDLFAARRGS